MKWGIFINEEWFIVIVYWKLFKKKYFSFINIPKISQNYNCLSIVEKNTRYNNDNLKPIVLSSDKIAIEF